MLVHSSGQCWRHIYRYFLWCHYLQPPSSSALRQETRQVLRLWRENTQSESSYKNPPSWLAAVSWRVDHSGRRRLYQFQKIFVLFFSFLAYFYLHSPVSVEIEDLLSFFFPCQPLPAPALKTNQRLLQPTAADSASDPGGDSPGERVTTVWHWNLWPRKCEQVNKNCKSKVQGGEVIKFVVRWLNTDIWLLSTFSLSVVRNTLFQITT